MAMKTTMDIPDAMYRQLKAQSAARGLAVREVMLQLIEQWVAGAGAVPEQANPVATALSNQQKAARLRAFLDETADLIARSPGPGLEQLLQEGRTRLEPGQ